MSDSEDDYMSDAFLASLTDTRPGLIHGKKAEKLQKQEQAAQKERENAKRKKINILKIKRKIWPR